MIGRVALRDRLQVGMRELPTVSDWWQPCNRYSIEQGHTCPDPSRWAAHFFIAFLVFATTRRRTFRRRGR